MKKINVGIIGYGFMGRAHSNAYRKVNHFFDLKYQPILKAVCARNADNAKAFAEKWGFCWAVNSIKPFVPTPPKLIRLFQP